VTIVQLVCLAAHGRSSRILIARAALAGAASPKRSSSR